MDEEIDLRPNVKTIDGSILEGGGQLLRSAISLANEAHVLKHSVTKPIIQEVREVITPMRKITQEIQPVQEEILTIVARGQEKEKSYGQSSGGYGAGASSGASGLLWRWLRWRRMKGVAKPQASSYGGAAAGVSMGRKGY